MRKVHRWLSVIFGLLILWIAVTGLLSQIGSLVNNRGFEEKTAEQGKRQITALGNAAVPPARAQDHDDPPTSGAINVGQPPQLRSGAFVCPADMTCRPKRTPRPGQWNLGFLHDIHSGATFGPIGVILSLLSSLALIFFAFSGMWMYVQMYRARTRNRAARGERSTLFW